MRELPRLLRRALLAKASVLAWGSSAVSPTCQIPLLREKYAAIGLPKRGTFVEIGGYDGESWSNTSFLADQGWRGIYVEPIPAFCRLIRLRHFLNEVRVEEAAVSDKPGVTQIALMGALTTCNGTTQAAYQDIPWAQPSADKSRILTVQTVTLSSLLRTHRVPDEFDLMVVDVEGHEEPIISELMASAWRPRVLIVELNDLHPDFAAFPELQASARRVRDAILAGGYQQFYGDPINSIFVRAG